MRKALAVSLSALLAFWPAAEAAAQRNISVKVLPTTPQATLPNAMPELVAFPQAMGGAALQALGAAEFQQPQTLQGFQTFGADGSLTSLTPTTEIPKLGALQQSVHGFLQAGKEENGAQNVENGSGSGAQVFDGGAKKQGGFELPDPNADAEGIDFYGGGQTTSRKAPVKVEVKTTPKTEPMVETPVQTKTEPMEEVPAEALEQPKTVAETVAVPAKNDLAQPAAEPLSRKSFAGTLGVMAVQGGLAALAVAEVAKGSLGLWTAVAAIGLPAAAVIAGGVMLAAGSPKVRKYAAIGLSIATVAATIAIAPQISALGFFSAKGIATSIATGLVSSNAMDSIKSLTGWDPQAKLKKDGKKPERRGRPEQHLLLAGTLGAGSALSVLAGAGWWGLGIGASAAIVHKIWLKRLPKAASEKKTGSETPDPFEDIKLPGKEKSAEELEALRKQLEEQLFAGDKHKTVLAVWTERDEKGARFDVRVRNLEHAAAIPVPTEFKGVEVRVIAVESTPAPPKEEKKDEEKKDENKSPAPEKGEKGEKKKSPPKKSPPKKSPPKGEKKKGDEKKAPPKAELPKAAKDILAKRRLTDGHLKGFSRISVMHFMGKRRSGFLDSLPTVDDPAAGKPLVEANIPTQGYLVYPEGRWHRWVGAMKLKGGGYFVEDVLRDESSGRVSALYFETDWLGHVVRAEHFDGDKSYDANGPMATSASENIQFFLRTAYFADPKAGTLPANRRWGNVHFAQGLNKGESDAQRDYVSPSALKARLRRAGHALPAAPGKTKKATLEAAEAAVDYLTKLAEISTTGKPQLAIAVKGDKLVVTAEAGRSLSPQEEQFLLDAMQDHFKGKGNADLAGVGGKMGYSRVSAEGPGATFYLELPLRKSSVSKALAALK